MLSSWLRSLYLLLLLKAAKGLSQGTEEILVQVLARLGDTSGSGDRHNCDVVVTQNFEERHEGDDFILIGE